MHACRITGHHSCQCSCARLGVHRPSCSADEPRLPLLHGSTDLVRSLSCACTKVDLLQCRRAQLALLVAWGELQNIFDLSCSCERHSLTARTGMAGRWRLEQNDAAEAGAASVEALLDAPLLQRLARKAAGSMEILETEEALEIVQVTCSWQARLACHHSVRERHQHMYSSCVHGYRYTTVVTQYPLPEVASLRSVIPRVHALFLVFSSAQSECGHWAALMRGCTL